MSEPHDRPPAAGAADRLQPAHRRSCSGSSASTSAGGSATRSTRTSLDYFGDTDQNDIALFLGYLFGVVGFLVGLGFLNYPLARMLGRPSPRTARTRSGGIGRYFGLCTDHKVVGIQYLVGIGLFFFIGGLNAMLIRSELLRPTPQRLRRRATT